VAQDDRATAQAAMPTDAEVPDSPARLSKPATTLKSLPGPGPRPCPIRSCTTFGFWSGTGANEGRTLTVAIVLDPANAPADRLLATLLPQDCAVDANGFHYVYDRQPYERSDGWVRHAQHDPGHRHTHGRAQLRIGLRAVQGRRVGERGGGQISAGHLRPVGRRGGQEIP